MEDLRWILLLVGALVIVAVYFSSRFEREDWVREREEFDARNPLPKKASRKKPLTKKAPITKASKPSSTIAQESSPAVSQTRASQIRKEPQMPSAKVEAEIASDTELPKAPLMPASEKHSVDVAAPLEAPTTSSASEIPAEVTVTEESVQAVFDAPTEESQDAASDAREDMPGLSIRAGIEDEITGVDIPADLAIAEAELHSTRHSENQQDSASPPDSDQQTLPENVDPLVLVLTVMAEDEPFRGAAVQEALEAEGLRHGEMRIFHCFDGGAASDSDEAIKTDSYDENALPIFSVASLIEPGYFELDKIDEMEMPGLTLFCQLPGPLTGPQSGEVAFNTMLDKGRGVAVRLHGQLCDDKRNVFTTQAKTHYLDRIANFVRELSVARKKVDV